VPALASLPMALPGLAPALAPLLLAPLLLIACWRDLVSRTIPDAIPLAIAALGLAARASLGWGALLGSLAVSLALFVLLLACAMRGVLGGGDVKLAAAVTLGLPPALAWDFLFATVLAGGLLGALYLAGPGFAPRLAVARGAAWPARLAAVEAWRLRRRGPLPYALAIAAGACRVLLQAAEG